MISRLSLTRVVLGGPLLLAGAAFFLALALTFDGVPASDPPPPSGSATANAEGQRRYVLPIAGDRPAVSSTFGEYRPGHFHAGVDFSTAGRVGIPVLAVDDGHVVRVRASGLGYGRAIYVQLRDGRLAVYAHLSSYKPTLARYVESQQDSLGRYRVDLWPEVGRFPVKRGETIGHSGRSGAGGPHFHFELREGDIALNPMSHGLTLDDAREPLLHALYFTPLSSAARVNGGARKLRVPLVQGTGVLTAREAIELRGPVAVSLQGHDPGRDPENRLGLYRLELWVNGASAFEAQFDRIDYLRNHEVEAQYDYEEALRGRRSVQNLFVPWGVTGAYYGPFQAGAGILYAGEAGERVPTTVGPGYGSKLSPGMHALRVVASDAAGKRTEAEVSLRVPPPSTPAPVAPRLAASSAAAGPAPLRMPRLELRAEGRIADALLDFGAPLSAPPVIRIPGSPSPAEVHLLGPGRYRVRFDALGQPALILAHGAADSAGAPAGDRLPLDWLSAPSGRALQGTLAGGRVLVELPSGAFFEDAYLWAAEDPTPPALSAGLKAASPVFVIEPGILPLDQGFWLGIRQNAGASGEGVALYRLDRGEWDHEGDEVRPEGIVGGTVKRLSHFVLARDVVPPHVEWLSPTAERLSTGAQPLLRARVRDSESGFREDDLTFFIDGRRVPSEWDPDAGDLRYTPRTPLAPGKHPLVVEARDRAGLTTRRELTITVRAAPDS
jgi:Peptidase family M23